jgi:hypothetical protein
MQLLPRKKLLQAAGDPMSKVVQVKTFQQLLDAWIEGAPHIELVNHLDAAGFPTRKEKIGGKEFSHVLPPQKASTKTVMVLTPGLFC